MCNYVVGVRRVPARVASATFGRFWGFGVGVGGGDDSVLLDFCKPTPPKLDSFSIQTRCIDAQDSEPRVVLHRTHSQWLALALSLLLCLRSADFMPAAGMLRSFADLNPQHNLGSVLHFCTLLRARRGCEHARRRKGHFP